MTSDMHGQVFKNPRTPTLNITHTCDSERVVGCAVATLHQFLTSLIDLESSNLLRAFSLAFSSFSCRTCFKVFLFFTLA